MRKLSKITEGILCDIIKRDLSGGKPKEMILHPETMKELREIIRDDARSRMEIETEEIDQRVRTFADKYGLEINID